MHSSHVNDEIMGAAALVVKASCNTLTVQWDLVLFMDRVEYRSAQSVTCNQETPITEQLTRVSGLVCLRVWLIN